MAAALCSGKIEWMIRNRQFSLLSLLVATAWIAVGLAIARYGWLNTSAGGIGRRLLIVAAFAWSGAGFGLANNNGGEAPFFGAVGGAMAGLYAQWRGFGNE